MIWSRPLLAGPAALLTLATGVHAQDYWPLDRIDAEMRAEAALPELEVHSGGDSPGIPVYLDAHDPLAALLQEATFLTTMQVASGADFGGMREGEALLDIVQTDNTTESIWVWSHYRTLTGDTQFDQNIADAWTYVMNHPAYAEEGGGGSLGYYRVYNSGWAMIAEPAYRAATGDASYCSYARTCAEYAIANPLAFNSLTPLVMRHVQAWAAGALYDFALEQGEATWRQAAVNYGAVMKAEVEADPIILEREAWAMAGGVQIWGILRSYFRENPGGREWALTHAPLTKTIDTMGNWRLAHTGWYALGRLEAWRATADPALAASHRAVVDFLVGADGDDDGAIPTGAYITTDQDETWVSNYLAFMGLAPLEPGFGAAIGTDVIEVAAGQPWTVYLGVQNHDALVGHRYDFVTSVVGTDGTTLPLLPTRRLALGPGQVLAAPPLDVLIPTNAGPGRYTARVSVFTLDGELADERSAVVRVP